MSDSSESDTRDRRLDELKQLLLDRNYKVNIINSAITKAKQIPRKQALEKVNTNTKNTVKRPVFAVMYDPRLPALPAIMKKHWRTMVENDPHLKEAFPLPPLVAYKRPQNVRDKLIRAKIPQTEKRLKRNIGGMKKCGNCPICPFIKEGKTIQSTASKFKIDVNKPVNCQSRNILYCIQCDKCRIQYIGESERTLQERFSEHKGYAQNNNKKKSTGEHFSQQGHKISDMKVTVIEKIFSSDPAIRKEREKFYIMKMNTKYKGLNKIS